MPAGVVKTKKDEKHWNQAKSSVKGSHPDYSGPRFYKAVMGVYKIITKNSKKKHKG